jgi:hypothetical protein
MRRQKSLMYCILSGAQRNNSVVVPHFLSIASSFYFFYSGCCWVGWGILWCDGSGAIDSGSGCRPLTGWDIAPTPDVLRSSKPSARNLLKCTSVVETSTFIGQHHLAVNCQGGAYFEIWTLQSFLNEHFLWTCLECKSNMTSLDGPDANLYIWILTSQTVIFKSTWSTSPFWVFV